MSGTRLVLAPLWVSFAQSSRPHSVTLTVISLCGAASDILDGYIARWTGTSSQFGRWLDSTADITFILSGLWCEARGGVIPYYLPALVAASFAQYVLDSVLIHGSAFPIKSRLGHWAGIFNYFLLILLAWAPKKHAPQLSDHLWLIIALFYLSAMFERAKTYRRAHAAGAVLPGQRQVSRPC
jgi:phosphatidylglycerophosphate synthase